MNTWVRRTIGILTLGGSFTGLALSTQLAQQQHQALALVFTFLFALVYAWGTWCGLIILESGKAAARQACVFWGLQIPHLMSPVAGFSLTSGAAVMVSYAGSTGIAFKADIGSHFQYSLLQGLPFSIGINLFALGIFVYLGVLSHQASDTPSSLPAEAPSA